MKITINPQKIYWFAVLLTVGIGVYLTILYRSRLLTVMWLAAGSLYIAASTTDAAILLLVFLFPFEMWLPNNFLYLIFFIIAIMREQKLPKAAVICSFLFVGLIVPWILTTDGAVSVMIKGQIILVVVFYTVLRGYQGADPTKICQALRLSAIIYSVNMVVISWKYAGSYVLENRLGYGLANRFPDLPKIPDGNTISFLMALAAISVLVEMYYTGKKYYLSLLWFLIVGFLTKSMTFLVVLVVIHILYYAFISPKGHKRIEQIILEGMTMAAGAIVIYALQPKFFSRFFKRMVASDISNGRISIFHEYNSSFINGNIWNILFGYGIQGTDSLANGQSLHHLMQAWYIFYGIIGFFCIVSIIIYMVWVCYKIRISKRSQIISMFPLLVFLIEVQAGNPSCAWLLPGLLMLSLSKLQGAKLHSA